MEFVFINAEINGPKAKTQDLYELFDGPRMYFDPLSSMAMANLTILQTYTGGLIFFKVTGKISKQRMILFEEPSRNLVLSMVL